MHWLSDDLIHKTRVRNTWSLKYLPNNPLQARGRSPPWQWVQPCFWSPTQLNGKFVRTGSSNKVGSTPQAQRTQTEAHVWYLQQHVSMLVPRQLLYGDSLSTTCLHTNAEVFGLTTYSHRLIPRNDNVHNHYQTAEQRKKEMTSFCAYGIGINLWLCVCERKLWSRWIPYLSIHDHATFHAPTCHRNTCKLSCVCSEMIILRVSGNHCSLLNCHKKS